MIFAVRHLDSGVCTSDFVISGVCNITALKHSHVLFIKEIISILKSTQSSVSHRLIPIVLYYCYT